MACDLKSHCWYQNYVYVQTFFLVILISTFFSSLRHILVYRSFAKKIFHGCLEDLYALLAMYMYVHMHKKVKKTWFVLLSYILVVYNVAGSNPVA